MILLNKFCLMMLNKPKYWDGKIGIISIILLPLSFILFFIFLKKVNKVNHFSIPLFVSETFTLVAQEKHQQRYC